MLKHINLHIQGDDTQELVDMLNEISRAYDIPQSQVLKNIIFHYHKRFQEKMSRRLPSIRAQLRYAQDCKCYYCGEYVRHKDATLDHKRPVSRGGLNVKENLVMACHGCNNLKEDMTVEEFWAYQRSTLPLALLQSRNETNSTGEEVENSRSETQGGVVGTL